MQQLDLYSSQIQSVYQDLEKRVIQMIIDRLNDKGLDDENFNVFSWQLDKLNQLHQLNNDTVQLISEATGINKSLLTKMIKDGGYNLADETSKQLSSDLNVDNIPVSSNVDQILRNMLNQTFLDLDNYVNQTLVTTNFGEGAVSKAYQSVLHDMVGSVTTGIETPKQVLNRAVYALIDKGLESGFTDKGGHHWGLSAYVRTVLESTKYRVMNEARMEQAHEYGLHTFLMSSHAASREACSHIQGQVVNDVPSSSSLYNSDYPSIYSYGYGDAGGAFGVNCKHMKFPFIPGVNENHMKQYDPKEAVKNGKTQQKQRQLERAIEKSKSKLDAAKQLEDKAGIEKYNALIKKQQSAMRQLVKENEFLSRDYSREKSYTPDKNYTIPNADKAEFDSKKLTKYALDKNSTSGGADKAKVFESALGYNKDNWKGLYDQVMAGVKKHEAIFKRKNAYGTAYEIDMPITGPNGKTVNVRTGWIIRNGESHPRLTSIYVKDKGDKNG